MLITTWTITHRCLDICSVSCLPNICFGKAIKNVVRTIYALHNSIRESYVRHDQSLGTYSSSVNHRRYLFSMVRLGSKSEAPSGNMGTIGLVDYGHYKQLDLLISSQPINLIWVDIWFVSCEPRVSTTSYHWKYMTQLSCCMNRRSPESNQSGSSRWWK